MIFLQLHMAPAFNGNFVKNLSRDKITCCVYFLRVFSIFCKEKGKEAIIVGFFQNFAKLHKNSVWPNHLIPNENTFQKKKLFCSMKVEKIDKN